MDEDLDPLSGDVLGSDLIGLAGRSIAWKPSSADDCSGSNVGAGTRPTGPRA